MDITRFAMKLFILIGMLSKVTTPSFKMDDVTLELKESCRNLGVIFDANMTLNSHISHVAKSVRYQLRNLSHIRKFLSRKATEQVVHSLIILQTWFLQLHTFQPTRISTQTPTISPEFSRQTGYPEQEYITHLTYTQGTSLASGACSHSFQDPPSSASISSKQGTNIHTGPDTTSCSTQTATFIKHQPASHPTHAHTTPGGPDPSHTLARLFGMLYLSTCDKKPHTHSLRLC